MLYFQQSFYCLISIVLLSIIPTTKNQQNETSSEFIDQLLKGYKKTERPGEEFIMDKEDQVVSGPPTVVRVSIDISSIGGFDAKHMEFGLHFRLCQDWNDPRLRHGSGSKTGRKLNMDGFRDRIWVPDLYFPKAVKSDLHDVTNQNHLVWVRPDGQVYFSQKLSVQHTCEMNLYNFPMDDQKCSLVMSSFGYTVESLIFDWQFKQDPFGLKDPNAALDEDVVRNEFTIKRIYTKSHNISHSLYGQFSGVKIEFHLQRKIGFYIVHAYLPSVLVLAISWISFVVDFTCAPARVSLGLLSILTLNSQSASVVEKLPTISYIKAIEVWLFTCIAFVVVSLLEFAFISTTCRDQPKSTCYADKESHGVKDKETHETKDKESEMLVNASLPRARGQLFKKNMGYKIDWVFFICYPLAFIIFAVIYWIYYLEQY